MRLRNFHFVYTFSSIFVYFSSICVLIKLWFHHFSCFRMDMWFFSSSPHPACMSPFLVIACLFLLVILILCFNLLLDLDRAACPVCPVYPCRFCTICNIHCHKCTSFSFTVTNVLKKFNFAYSRIFFSRRSSSLLHSSVQRKNIFDMLRT